MRTINPLVVALIILSFGFHPVASAECPDLIDSVNTAGQALAVDVGGDLAFVADSTGISVRCAPATNSGWCTCRHDQCSRGRRALATPCPGKPRWT